MQTALATLGVLFIFLVLSLLLALPTMWMWNYVMPYFFGIKEADFWHAFAINCLASILFKSSSSGSSSK